MSTPSWRSARAPRWAPRASCPPRQVTPVRPLDRFASSRRQIHLEPRYRPHRRSPPLRRRFGTPSPRSFRSSPPHRRVRFRSSRRVATRACAAASSATGSTPRSQHCGRARPAGCRDSPFVRGRLAARAPRARAPDAAARPGKTPDASTHDGSTAGPSIHDGSSAGASTYQASNADASLQTGRGAVRRSASGSPRRQPGQASARRAAPFDVGTRCGCGELRRGALSPRQTGLPRHDEDECHRGARCVAIPRAAAEARARCVPVVRLGIPDDAKNRRQAGRPRHVDDPARLNFPRPVRDLHFQLEDPRQVLDVVPPLTLDPDAEVVTPPTPVVAALLAAAVIPRASRANASERPPDSGRVPPASSRSGRTCAETDRSCSRGAYPGATSERKTCRLASRFESCTAHAEKAPVIRGFLWFETRCGCGSDPGGQEMVRLPTRLSNRLRRLGLSAAQAFIGHLRRSLASARLEMTKSPRSEVRADSSE